MKVLRLVFPTPSLKIETDVGVFELMPFAPTGFHKILKQDSDSGEFMSSGVDDLKDEEIEFLLEMAKVALQGG